MVVISRALEMWAVVIHFVGRDSLAGPDLAEGCLQYVEFPGAWLCENSYVASIPSRHTRFVQCLVKITSPTRTLRCWEVHCSCNHASCARASSGSEVVHFSPALIKRNKRFLYLEVWFVFFTMNIWGSFIFNIMTWLNGLIFRMSCIFTS